MFHQRCAVEQPNIWTDPGKEDIYSGVVGIDAVRAGFMLGELNGLSCYIVLQMLGMLFSMVKLRRKFTL